jgi:hypothetical protein
MAKVDIEIVSAAADKRRRRMIELRTEGMRRRPYTVRVRATIKLAADRVPPPDCCAASMAANSGSENLIAYDE